MTGLGGMTNHPANSWASPNDQADTHDTASAGDTCAPSEPHTRHFIARRLRAMVRLAIVLVVLLLVVFAGGALFLASSAGKALVLRALSASLL